MEIIGRSKALYYKKLEKEKICVDQDKLKQTIDYKNSVRKLADLVSKIKPTFVKELEIKRKKKMAEEEKLREKKKKEEEEKMLKEKSEKEKNEKEMLDREKLLKLKEFEGKILNLDTIDLEKNIQNNMRLLEPELNDHFIRYFYEENPSIEENFQENFSSSFSKYDTLYNSIDTNEEAPDIVIEKEEELNKTFASPSRIFRYKRGDIFNKFDSTLSKSQFNNNNELNLSQLTFQNINLEESSIPRKSTQYEGIKNRINNKFLNSSLSPSIYRYSPKINFNNLSQYSKSPQNFRNYRKETHTNQFLADIAKTKLSNIFQSQDNSNKKTQINSLAFHTLRGRYNTFYGNKKDRKRKIENRFSFNKSRGYKRKINLKVAPINFGESERDKRIGNYLKVNVLKGEGEEIKIFDNQD